MKSTALLRRRILSRQAAIAVVGQGYVGLTLACTAAEEGFPVIGFDIDKGRIEDLSQGTLSVPGVEAELFASAIATGRMTFTNDPAEMERADIIVICVPTPVRDQSPDLTFVDSACETLSRHLRPGRLVVLESTTYPGTTEERARPLLEISGLVAGKDFLLSYSPERIDPGNVEFSLRNTPKIVGGLSREAAGVTALFYGQFVDKVVLVSSSRAAELAKLLENTFRHVNVALVNEMAMLCHEMDIDVWEVIHATATKPFGFMPFYPGPGVGGHCIPLDPTYLAWQVRRDAGHQFRILEQAQDINAQMPAWVASRIGDVLNDAGKAVKSAKIFILGVSYKPDVGDLRESPAIKVAQILWRRGGSLSFHDPYIDEIAVNGSFIPRSDLTLRAVTNADCVAILTPHKDYDLDWVGENARLVFDARNAFADDKRSNVVTL
ncbi:MAG: nucleotide sugar dehydrogenase [Actinomycetota bacterium]